MIALELDLTPHVWAGERECAGRASLFRGPILLTYDPRFNPGRPVDPAPLDLSETDRLAGLLEGKPGADPPGGGPDDRRIRSSSATSPVRASMDRPTARGSAPSTP